MTDAELRSLLVDCLAVWDVVGTVMIGDAGAEIVVGSNRVTLCRAEADDRPVRWLMQTPERAAACREPRPLPSIVAGLTALRAAIA